MNFFAVVRLAALERYDAVANMPSSSIAVPTLWNGMTFRSESLKSFPVFGFFDSSTWASSLYVIAEAESTWCWTKKPMLNGSWTIVTSFELFGLIPYFVSAANRSHWLPPSQLATFLCFICAIVLMPEDFHVICVIPERAKTCAMLTSFVPWSREASRLGSQSIPNC